MLQVVSWCTEIRNSIQYITCSDTFLAVILGRKFLGLYHQEVTREISVRQQMPRVVPMGKNSTTLVTTQIILLFIYIILNLHLAPCSLSNTYNSQPSVAQNLLYYAAYSQQARFCVTVLNKKLIHGC